MAEATDDRKKLLEDPSISNAQKAALWKIDVNQNPYAMPLDALDPGHPELFEADKFWPYFERLRREDPVHYTRESQFGPYWSITKFSDIMYVDTHHQIFSSENSQGGITLGGRPLAEGEVPDPTYDLPMFIMSDPPKHDLQRGVVAPVFLPRQIAALESLIRERASTILDNLPRNEDFNWVRHVSVELTGQMLATLFDIPLEDRQKLIYWSDATSNLGNPEYFDIGGGGLQGAVGMRRVLHGDCSNSARTNRRSRTSSRCWRTARRRRTCRRTNSSATFCC